LTTISESFLIGTNSTHDETSPRENDLYSSREASYPALDTYDWVVDPRLSFRAIQVKVLGEAARGCAENTSRFVPVESEA
jgi:two-component SAPR family response regulator